MAGDAAGGPPAHDADEAGDPSFEIPAHPERRYPYEGGVEYEGETVFTLTPGADRSSADLRDLVEATLTAGPYRHGDFFDLPMPLYLVRDDETADVFRISVRDGRVRLHVLPATESAGLRAFYDRLVARSDADWRVDCRTTV
ncbi:MULTISPECIES: hypothetical protein [Salinibaculum]|uniref:hypothetical protein n=1 Tax=Salinibaculum TaxID=2732368 RepID=UPI0030D02B85